MKNRIELLSKIKFNFWLNKNRYYGDIPLNSSMKGALTLVKNKGFLNNYSNFSTCSELVGKINENIKYLKPDLNNNEKLLETFDLIQVWGGRNGRQPYIISGKRNRSYRSNYKEWLELYKSGIKEAILKNFESSINILCQIDGLGDSFATKHLKFWGDLPILDSRMRILFNSPINSSYKYDQFLTDLNEISRILKHRFTIIEIERSIFAFSQNFFKNNKLEMKPNQDYLVDKEIADKFLL